VLAVASLGMLFGTLPPHYQSQTIGKMMFNGIEMTSGLRATKAMPVIVCYDEEDDLMHKFSYCNNTLLECYWSDDDLDIAQKYVVLSELRLWYNSKNSTNDLRAKLDRPLDLLAWYGE